MRLSPIHTTPFHRRFGRLAIVGQSTRRGDPSAHIRLALAERDEGGAILILALIFVIIVTLSIFGLITFGGTGILNAANLKGQRSLEFAADGAATAAIQAVRYSNYTFSQTGIADCLPDGAILNPATDTQSLTINNVTMWVDCAATQLPSSQPSVSRAIIFYACQVATGCSGSNATVVATVYFDDTSPSGLNECSPPTETATCGSGMTIDSWVVETANN